MVNLNGVNTYHMLRIKYIRVLALFSKQERFRPNMVTYPLQLICLSLLELLYLNLGNSISNSYKTAILAQKQVVRPFHFI